MATTQVSYSSTIAASSRNLAGSPWTAASLLRSKPIANFISLWWRLLSDNVTAFSVPATNVIVIGASAGGVSAVCALLNKFPQHVPAAIFVVVHTSPEGPGMLASVLDRATELTVVTAEDGVLARHGHVYVAPPDYHLIIDGGHIRLNHGPREHRSRPAVDPLFRTASQHYGARAIGVVLSGNMADGTHGLTLIKEAGGVTIVQDPDEAQAPSMPLNAMRRGVDYVLPVNEMPRVVMGLLMNGRDRRARRSLRLTAFSGSLEEEIGDMKRRAAALRRLLLDPPKQASTPVRRARKRQAHG
jgi:chemotaxis response regulator CheB